MDGGGVRSRAWALSPGLLPTIEVAVPVTARAAAVPTGVGVPHQRTQTFQWRSCAVQSPPP
jgi:hypothetical protein